MYHGKIINSLELNVSNTFLKQRENVREDFFEILYYKDLLSVKLDIHSNLFSLSK